MKSSILYLLTRTPLHVGAGASVGAIDQPIQRERHTAFPIIPATSLKGTFADQWPANHDDGKGGKLRISTDDGVLVEASDTAWLFGSDTTDLAFAGALIFSEARLLAFPIRSARGSYAWITSPLMLHRAKRDGVLTCQPSKEPADDQAIFDPNGPLALGDQIVLEEYCLTQTDQYPAELAKEMASLVEDALFKTITERLVILSDGMMSHFVNTACEVAQHVRINDATGTADGGALFNQENVPSDALFYSLLMAEKSRVPDGSYKDKTAEDALDTFKNKVDATKVFQFGGDASTGLGFCSVSLKS